MRLKKITKLFCTLLISSMMLTINVQAKTKIKQLTTTTCVVKNNKKTIQKGKATYYGSHYTSKRKTASGEYYNKEKLTAAHKTLPFGTMVKVTNTKNNKTVVVKINDRGSLGNGCIIDLSVAAAKELDILKCGTTTVIIEII